MQQFVPVGFAHMVAGAIAHDMGVETLGNLALDALKGAAADEQDILGVDSDHLLLGVLASALGRHVDHRSLKEFKQTLLDALATDVTRDAGIVALARDLVNLVNEDNTPLGLGNIVITSRKQTGQQALNILTHIAGLGQHGGVDNSEGHFQHFGYRFGQQGFSCTSRTHDNDVALLDVDVVVTFLAQALVMVVDSDRKIAFGRFLPDDILVEIGLYLIGFGKRVHIKFG